VANDDNAGTAPLRPGETVVLPAKPDAIAPDGSDVRLLGRGTRGGMAHFVIGAGECSVAVRHRTVEEIWYFVEGRGEMWRSLGDVSLCMEVESGMSITIPTGAHFQFRASDDGPLAAIGVTMPPWPGDGEAIAVEGCWRPTLRSGPGLAEA
jgi:mannose-6-phosphate isomerase-like protein (cupin superfamily)